MPHAFAQRSQLSIAILSLVAIAVHLACSFSSNLRPFALFPLYGALLLGGVPLVWELIRKLFRREFGSDLLAGISIVTATLLEEYLADTLVVLMLSGGEALEAYAVRRSYSANANWQTPFSWVMVSTMHLHLWRLLSESPLVRIAT